MSDHHPRCDMMEAASFGSMGNQCTCIECYKEDVAYLKQQLLAEQSTNEILRRVLQEAADGMGGSFGEWEPKARLALAFNVNHTALREHDARLLEEVATHFRKTWRPMHDWDRHVEAELRRMAKERRDGNE